MDILSNPYLMVVFNALISGGAFLSFVMFIATLALLKPRRSVPYLTVLCLVVGVLLLYAWFNLNTLIFRPAWLNYIFIGAVFTIGPAVYVFYHATIDENYELTPKRRWLFAPGIIFTVLNPLINLVAPQIMPADPREYFITGKPSVMDAFFTAAMLQNGYYVAKLFLETRSVMKQPSGQEPAGARAAFFLFFGILTFITIYGIFTYIVRDIRHFYADCCIIALLVVSFVVFALRYPHYFLKIRPE